MIALSGEPLTAKRYAARLLARELYLLVGQWPPPPQVGSMTDRERTEVGRHLRELRDRCLRLLGEELPEHWARAEERP